MRNVNIENISNKNFKLEDHFAIRRQTEGNKLPLGLVTSNDLDRLPPIEYVKSGNLSSPGPHKPRINNENVAKWEDPNKNNNQKGGMKKICSIINFRNQIPFGKALEYFAWCKVYYSDNKKRLQVILHQNP